MFPIEVSIYLYQGDNSGIDFGQNPTVPNSDGFKTVLAFGQPYSEDFIYEMCSYLVAQDNIVFLEPKKEELQIFIENNDIDGLVSTIFQDQRSGGVSFYVDNEHGARGNPQDTKDVVEQIINYIENLNIQQPVQLEHPVLAENWNPHDFINYESTTFIPNSPAQIQSFENLITPEEIQQMQAAVNIINVQQSGLQRSSGGLQIG